MVRVSVIHGVGENLGGFVFSYELFEAVFVFGVVLGELPFFEVKKMNTIYTDDVIGVVTFFFSDLANDVGF